MLVRGIQARAALAAGGAVMAVTLVGCGGGSGGSGDDKAAVATKAAASETSASAEPEPEPEVELVYDDESSDAGKPVVVKVLENDTIPFEGGEFSVAVDTQPQHGSVEVDGDTIVYTSDSGYGGEDEFTYRLDVDSAAAAITDTAVVRITVTKLVPKATPTPTPKPKPRPTKPKTIAPPPVYYQNCDAAREAGAAPVRSGDPGYGRHLDRDGDGVGCEPYNGSSGGGGSSNASGGSGGGGGSASYANCDAVRAAGAAPIRSGDPGYGRHLDRDGDGVGCE